MSDLTTIARPYAKAAFDFAVDKGELDQWGQMLTFAAEVAQNDDVHNLLSGSMTAEKLAEVFIVICGEQFDEFGQNLIKVMAENGRLMAFPDVCKQFLLLKQEHEKEIEHRQAKQGQHCRWTQVWVGVLGEPDRENAALVDDPFRVGRVLRDERRNLIGIGCGLPSGEHRTCSVYHADRNGFDGNVEANIMRQGRSPSRLVL